MKITICGSMLFKYEMVAAAETLRGIGYEVEIPDLNEHHSYEGKSIEERSQDKSGFIRDHLEKIRTSDAILVFNKEKNGIPGYVGGNTLMEMAFAYAQDLEIFLLNPVPDISYASEIRGMLPIGLDGDVSGVNGYFMNLPVAYVSSESPIKLRAVSRGLRRAGIRTRVSGLKTVSNVSEQPASMDETYRGADNRHAALAGFVPDDAAYIVTIECGVCQPHEKHGTFGCAVAIVERVGQARKTGFELVVEFPAAMLNKVPSVYPDLGVLVQKEYGSSHKDPYPYFTQGKLTRLQLMETVLFNTAVQLEG